MQIKHPQWILSHPSNNKVISITYNIASFPQSCGKYFRKLSPYTVTSSLVPRLSLQDFKLCRGVEKAGAANESLVSSDSRTHTIFLEFQEAVYFRKLPCYFYVTITGMAEGSGESEFQRALGYAVQRVQTATFVPKPEQTAAIRAIYCGKDVFVWLPTGFGKSFCYEAIPFVLDWKLDRTESRTVNSLVLIVSPLVALMVDQVRSLRARV